jgi:hypothetical protein
MLFPQVLLAKITGKQAYKDKVQGYCDYITTSQTKTPKGLVYIDQWGSLRMAANAAFICAQVNTRYLSAIFINIKQFIVCELGERTLECNLPHKPITRDRRYKIKNHRKDITND